jgi:hypothetical protein
MVMEDEGVETLCVDCGMDCHPCEWFMVSDDVWRQAGGVDGALCVACLEDRIGRALVPGDFQPLPVNDDDERDTVRLRFAKSSGRQTAALYGLASRAVVNLGVDPQEAATALGLDVSLVGTWVESERTMRDLDGELGGEP